MRFWGGEAADAKPVKNETKSQLIGWSRGPWRAMAGNAPAARLHWHQRTLTYDGSPTRSETQDADDARVLPQILPFKFIVKAFWKTNLVGSLQFINIRTFHGQGSSKCHHQCVLGQRAFAAAGLSGQMCLKHETRRNLEGTSSTPQVAINLPSLKLVSSSTTPPLAQPQGSPTFFSSKK